MIIPMTDDERRLTEEYLYLVPEMVKKLTTATNQTSKTDFYKGIFISTYLGKRLYFR